MKFDRKREWIPAQKFRDDSIERAALELLSSAGLSHVTGALLQPLGIMLL